MRKSGLGKTACIVAVFCVATAIASPAQTFTTLGSFEGHDGILPADLIQGANGNFYGVAGLGAANGWGSLFEITAEGEAATIYNFCAQTNCTDGAYPQGGLVLGANENFYGTTFTGGNSNCDGCGDGTVFKITPGGELTTLYSFCSQTNCTDGFDPEAGLAQGANGNYYGTTFYGGANAGSNGSGGGTLFEITPSGKLTMLYSFCSLTNCTDGANPLAAPLLAANGILYGTTFRGGSDNAGTVFEITPAGQLITVHNFTSTAGSNQNAGPLGLIQGADGNLYGITNYGGTANYGTVFAITPAGTFTNLYNFCSQPNCTDGAGPVRLLQGSDGNFYGTTALGGTGLPGCGGIGCGTVFEITAAGTLTTLYSFCTQEKCPDGSGAYGLVQATTGNFYGTTQEGGASDDGTVFSLSVGLGPFVEASPTVGETGRAISILGNNLTGTTSVTFNGTPATFDVVSGTYIMAEVPSDATTGTIEVTTPSGTLSSNVAFQVE
jgi:uncharacterized repeat protein (TIGR03803 family)